MFAAMLVSKESCLENVEARFQATLEAMNFGSMFTATLEAIGFFYAHIFRQRWKQ